jgi:hypothetical protein
LRRSKETFLLLATLALLSMPGLQASAQDGLSDRNAAQSPAAGKATNIVRLSGSIVGIMTATSGACTTGFSNQCPSGHICGCFTATAAKVSSPALGAGSANIFATIDDTAAFGLGACAPVYAEIDITAKKDSPTFDAVGSLCFEPDGETVFNGGMALVVATSRLFTTSGSAGFTATLKATSGLGGGGGRLVWKFKGSAE